MTASAASSSEDVNRNPFNSRNSTPTTNPVRLLPSAERMVPDDAARVDGRQIDDVYACIISRELPRSGQCRFQQASVSHAGPPAMRRKQAVMDRKDHAFLDPGRLRIHFARTCKVLR